MALADRQPRRVATLAIAAALAVAGCRGSSNEPAGQSAHGVEALVRPGPVPAPAPTMSSEPVRGPLPGQAIAYTLRFPAPHTQYVEVEAAFPVAALAPAGQGAVVTAGPGAAEAAPDAIELFLPVWTPGSYLVREHSRHVEALVASTPEGAPLAVDKVRKNRWRVSLADSAPAAESESVPERGPAHVIVRYRVYARDLSVRTNFVDADIAVLNGAATFVTAAGGESLPHEVTVVPAADWAAGVTALPPHPDGAGHHYLAPDYDALVDSPIVAGNPEVGEFAIDGVRHRVATFLADARWDNGRVTRDIETMARAQARFWGGMPYQDYVFLGVLGGGAGGLEHRSSTLMLGNPLQTPRDYRRWLGLASHELFHAWNVKRLRPLELGPFDWDSEVYTRSLWVVEGLTSYYGDLLLRRSGLIDDEQYLGELSRRIEAVQSAPGRKVQSLAQSSYDAWIELYRPDENSANTTISYYQKGAVVGFLLDAEIRRRTGGRRSLDDVMRLAYQRHAGDRGYTPEQFRALVGEVAGSDLGAFFARAVDGAEELDFEPAFAYLGLRFEPPAARSKDEDGEPGWLGATTRVQEGRLVVTEVRRETPAHAAGVNVEDEILAIDEQRVPAAGLDELVRYYGPGTEVSLLVARRGRLRRIPVTLGEKPTARWGLQVAPGASRQQLEQRTRWLTGT
jgi:predicted metalloprotease with PDZ domain